MPLDNEIIQQSTSESLHIFRADRPICIYARRCVLSLMSKADQEERLRR
jgi:hypothetical protein